MGERFDKAKTKFQKTKKVRRAWSLYKWADRLWNWHDWYTWISTFLQTKAGVAAAMVSTAAVTTTAAVVTHQVIEQPASEPYAQVETVPLPPQPAPPKVVVKEEPPPPPPPKVERQTESTVIFAIEGRDAAGRKGTFDVVVAKKEVLWVKKRSDQLEKAGQIVPNEALASEVFDDEVKRGIDKALGIIAVGTASQEGNPEVETERAHQRAKRTAEIVLPLVDPAMPVWALNLGQFKGACPECETGGTNWQRPFMVIAIKALEEGTDLGQALTDAMTGKGRLPSPKSYSAFVLEKVR